MRNYWFNKRNYINAWYKLLFKKEKQCQHKKLNLNRLLDYFNFNNSEIQNEQKHTETNNCENLKKSMKLLKN